MPEAALRAGRYLLRRRLGTGGMAVVWLAEASGPEGVPRQVVVKAILPHLARDPGFVRLFLSEARLAARLDHPNVVQVVDLFQERGEFFSVMEYVDGGSLRQLMRSTRDRGQQLDPAVVTRVLIDACQGLAYVHTLSDAEGRPLGVVHQDISPDNILITRSGVAKVADFGIARASNSASQGRPAVQGKLSYAPPETHEWQQPDARSDLFALGVVGYEALTGRQPFRAATDAETIGRVRRGDVPPLRSLRPDVSPQLEAAIATAMHRDRSARYADAAAMGRALEPFAPPSSSAALRALIQTLPQADAPLAVRSTWAPRVVVAGLSVLLGFSITLGALRLTRAPAPPEPLGTSLKPSVQAQVDEGKTAAIELPKP